MSVLQEISLGKYFTSQLHPKLILVLSQTPKLARLAMNFSLLASALRVAEITGLWHQAQ